MAIKWPLRSKILTLAVGEIDGRYGRSQKDGCKQGRRELEPIFADDSDHIADSDIGQSAQAFRQSNGLLQQFQVPKFRPVDAIDLMQYGCVELIAYN